MRKIFIVVLCLLFGIDFGLTQNEKLNSSLLWEITGKKVKTPAYLFGTMHIVPADQFYITEDLKEKLKNSELLIMEVGGLMEQAKAMNIMVLDTGNLFDFFSKEQRDSIFEYAEEILGYDEATMRTSFGKFKPFVLVQTFTAKAFGDSPESYELTFEQIARKQKIEVLGLETIEEQIGIIDSLNVESQISMVMETIRGNSKENDEMKKLISTYYTQDIDKIYASIIDSGMNSPDFQEKMLNKRNRNWIAPIKKYIRKKKAFIAVGAGHLGGENGVIQLLRNEGYEVTPVKF